MAGLLAFMSAIRGRENYGIYGNANEELGPNYLFNPERPGAYQFGLPELKFLGYLSDDSTSVSGGSWTGPNAISNRVSSVEEWLSSPAAQNEAFIRWIFQLWGEIRQFDYEHYAGSTLNETVLTMSGMIAAAHLVSTGIFVNRFIQSGGTDIPTDLNNPPTPVTE